jgi:hypothetical protein
MGLLMLTASRMPAQSPPEPVERASPPAVESAESSPTATTGSPLAERLKVFFGDSGFEELLCQELFLGTEGEIRIKGRVSLKTTQMGIVCNTLDLNPETKILTALGTPVKLRQGDVNAECRKFTYDIEKKQSILEDHPIIKEKSGEQVMVVTAERITLTQDENGKISVFMKTSERSLTEIKMMNGGEKPAGATEQPQKEEPKRVNGEQGRQMIRAPGPDQ